MNRATNPINPEKIAPLDATGTSVATVANDLRKSASLDNAIDAIIDEMKNEQRRLDRVRGPIDTAHEGRYQRLLHQACKARGKEKLFFDYIGSGLGNGPFVELADGSVKLDMINGIGVHFFGHNDPGVVRASIIGAMGDTIMQGNLQANEDANEFAQILVDEAAKNSRLEHVFLTNSGCMANESAIKVCFQKNVPASRVLAFAHCFMGRSVTMSQIGDSAANRQGVPLSTLVDYMPFYNPELGTKSIDLAAAKLEEYIGRYPGQHAAFVFELVQGEGGYNTAPREFFTTLMEICRSYGIAVWADEVQTFGRTGEMFGFDTINLGEYIDVCTIGKLSQVCACLFTKDYNPKPGLLSGTFIGTTVGLNAGAYMLKTLRDGGFYGKGGKIEAHHQRFVEGVRAIAGRHPNWFPPIVDAHGNTLTKLDIVGGLGGMMRFSPFGGERGPVSQLIQTLFIEGMLSFYCGHGPFHVRMLPPLGIMKMEQWDAVFEVIERSMGKVAGQD